MPAVLRTLMANFFIPYMNVHHMIVTYFEDNIASRRVFEKNGFTFDRVVPGAFTLPESKGGRTVGAGVMVWKR